MNPRKSAAARIITSEPSGRWAVALRRELGGEATVEEARSVAECWQRLADAPASMVVVEVTTGNVEALLARLAQRQREFPRSRVAVVAERRLAGYEWLLREAGAVMFVTSPRRLAPLAAAARRHLEAQPEPAVGTAERIWAGLPWSEHATVRFFSGTANECR